MQTNRISAHIKPATYILRTAQSASPKGRRTKTKVRKTTNAPEIDPHGQKPELEWLGVVQGVLCSAFLK